jgi:hypothetical protein
MNHENWRQVMRVTIACMLSIAVALLLAETRQAEAGTWESSLGTSEVTTFTPSDTSLGQYYTFTITLPSELDGKTIYSAMLEFYVDASARAVNGYVDESPVIGVYALNGPLTGAPDEDSFRQPSAAVRNVMAGTARKVKVNITDIVRGFQIMPSSNHGLIVGALIGIREGRFSLRRDVLPGSGLARIRVHYGR